MGYVSIPTNLTGYSRMANGNFTGNGSANRAIAHSMPIIPKIIFVYSENTNATGIGAIIDTHLRAVHNTVETAGTVTATDNTNFYTGKSGTFELNNNTFVYNWVAFG